MAAKKTTATAGKDAMPKPRGKQAHDIKNVTLTKMTRGAKRYPAALYMGDQPAKGDTLRFTLANGVTYSGKVRAATESGGEVLAEFEDGIAPVPTK